MSLTLSSLQRHDAGDQFKITGLMTFDSSYPTGGETLSASLLGLSIIDDMQIVDSEGYSFDCDIAAGGASALIKAYLGDSSSHLHAAGTLANAASAVTPGFHGTVDGITVGTPALTYNADPVTNLSANPLFVVEAYGVGNKNIGVLQSNCAGTTSILGSVDDVSGACGAATPRFWVTHNATPAGVQVYVNESDNDKLCCVSPTEQDVIVMMPFEAIADGVPGFAYAVTIHHDAAAATYKPLYFDDNGAADAQLAFVDAGGVGGVIYAADIEVVGPQYTGITGNCGSAAAQTISGSTAATAPTDAAGAEVANATNLSSLAVNFTAYGK